MNAPERKMLSGDEAVALAALHADVRLGTGYPGTPSTEILETFEKLGGRAQWAPNEKVALEVGIGAAFAGARAVVTMKHVGLNVAADPFVNSGLLRIDPHPGPGAGGPCPPRSFPGGGVPVLPLRRPAGAGPRPHGPGMGGRAGPRGIPGLRTVHQGLAGVRGLITTKSKPAAPTSSVVSELPRFRNAPVRTSPWHSRCFRFFNVLSPLLRTAYQGARGRARSTDFLVGPAQQGAHVGDDVCGAGAVHAGIAGQLRHVI